MKNNLPYSPGTIKLTWIDPNNYKILNSQMFGSVQDALNNTDQIESLGNNWLIFELVQTDGQKYQWKVLPYGKHKGYVNGMKLRDNLFLRYGSILLMVLGAYMLYKLIANGKKL